MKSSGKWTTEILQDVCEFTRKPTGVSYSDYPEIPFVPMENVLVGRTYVEDFNLKSSKYAGSGNYFEDGDILFAKITPCFENGKQSIVRNLPGKFGIASTELIPIRGKKGKSSTLFIHYFLLESERRRRIAQKMEGATGRQRVPISVLKNWPISLPPLPEQEKIAAVLLNLQNAISIQEKIIQSLRELKKSTMNFVFSRGLRREKIKSTPIGEIPESWEVFKIGGLFNVQLGKMLSQKARVGNNPKFYLRNKNVQWGKVDVKDMLQMDFTQQEMEKFSLLPGDLLICEGGEPGRAAIWQGQIQDCYYQKALLRLRPKSKCISNEFLTYWLMFSIDMKKLYGNAGASSTIAHLPAGQLKSLPIPCPERTEMNMIVKNLDAIFKKLDFYESQKSVLQDLFKTTLNKLMTGEIRAGELDISIQNG